MRCDVAIGALSAPHGRTPCIVSEDVVKKMKSGSVIVDVSIDKGTFETSNLTSHDKPTFEKYGVTHYCVPNIPSRYSRTSSLCISNIITLNLVKSKKYGTNKTLLEIIIL